ncbi:MAG: invasion-associated locus B family protein [Hyphomicrobiales bacterium]|nr:invasion associated locus B family protein [Hyphomicrobiales bacterium]PCH50236.1 MAG: invasion-associated locus B family protein [Hyphomicrobiales bacterium]
MKFCNFGSPKSHAVSLAALFLATVTLFAMPADPVFAQGVVKSQHGEWSLVCDTPPGASSEQCALMQNVVAEDREEMGLSVVILRTADRKSELLRVLAPLGVLLPNGLGLYIDDKDIGNAFFTRCFNDGCYAEVVLKEKLLEAFKTGKSATFIVFQTPEEGIGIPIDLTGFTEGFAKIP